MSQPVPPKSGPRCGDCPMRERGIIVHDRFDESTYNGLSLVGELPGREEVRQHLVFVGPTGRLTDTLMRSCSIDTRSVHITNCIRCGLRGGAKLNEKDAELAMECCRPLVVENLGRVGARSVLLMGAVPLRALTGLVGINKYRGCIVGMEGEHPWITTCTFHPASVLRHKAPQQNVELVYYDLRKAMGLASGDVEIWDPDIRDPKDVDSMIDLLRQVLTWRLPMAVDVETSEVLEVQKLSDRTSELLSLVVKMADLFAAKLQLEPPSERRKIEQIPVQATIEFSRGVDFEDRGDTAQAVEHYRKALEIFPNHRDARKALERLEKTGGAER